jgi:hypothetical protein
MKKNTMMTGDTPMTIDLAIWTIEDARAKMTNGDITHQRYLDIMNETLMAFLRSL